jgi:hypothetical protein
LAFGFKRTNDLHEITNSGGELGTQRSIFSRADAGKKPQSEVNGSPIIFVVAGLFVWLKERRPPAHEANPQAGGLSSVGVWERPSL